MARSDRDAARFQTQFLTNRDVAGTSDAYSLLVHEDGALTRYRYALLAILFAVNLFISVAVLVLAVLKQPAPSDVHWEAVSAMTNDSQEWMTCRRYYATDSKRTRQDCAVINDRFCHAASKVINSCFFIALLFIPLPEFTVLGLLPHGRFMTNCSASYFCLLHFYAQQQLLL